MKTFHKVSLKPYNTFHLDAIAEKLYLIEHYEDAWQIRPDGIILGGGSNVLFLQDSYEQPIYINQLKGIALIEEDEHHVRVSVASGEEWHTFVMKCLQNGWFGLENLALIPGTVGAAPIQNIGAYGVEVKDFVYSIEGIFLDTHQPFTIISEQAEWGYRDSIFKKLLKGKIFITHVVFKLLKEPRPNVSYKDVQNALKEAGINTPTPFDIAQTVIKIRRSKLPDTKQVGNAGSFFKNPVISQMHFQELLSYYTEMPYYAQQDATYKIPAAWLIEQCGWKGYRDGDVGVHHIQPLVLVNYGNASGKQLFYLAQNIQQSVKQKFGISLENEVNLVK